MSFFDKTVKSHIETSVNIARAARYHRRHKNEAFRILEILKKTGIQIDKTYKKQCDEYSRHVFGTRKYAPWLYVYTAISGEFKEGWIPDNYWGACIVPKYKGGYGTSSRLNAFNNILFRNSLFPDILYYVNGLFLNTDGKVILESQLMETLFYNKEKIIYKIDDSKQGRGVYIFNKSNFDVNFIRRLDNGVFQNYINQNRSLSVFAPDSTATVRITTVCEDNGSISARAGYLRLGRAGESHVQSKTHVRVSFDLNTGGLYEYGHTTKWRCIKKHPDSKIEFSGREIPSLESCINAVIKLHEMLPCVRCIGWDVAIDENGNPHIMEWNGGHNDIKYSEATQGPCFSDLGWI